MKKKIRKILKLIKVKKNIINNYKNIAIKYRNFFLIILKK